MGRVAELGSGGFIENQIGEQWTLLPLHPNKCAALLAGNFRSCIRNSSLPARDRMWLKHIGEVWLGEYSPDPNAGGLFLLGDDVSRFEKLLETEAIVATTSLPHSLTEKTKMWA